MVITSTLILIFSVMVRYVVFEENKIKRKIDF